MLLRGLSSFGHDQHHRIKLSKDLPGPACWGCVLGCCPSSMELLPVLILQQELSGVTAPLSLLPSALPRSPENSELHAVFLLVSNT